MGSSLKRKSINKGVFQNSGIK